MRLHHLALLVPAALIAALFWELAKGPFDAYLPLRAIGDVLLGYYIVVLYVVPAICWLVLLTRARVQPVHPWQHLGIAATALLVMDSVLVAGLSVLAPSVLRGLVHDQRSAVAFLVVLPLAFGLLVVRLRFRQGPEGARFRADAR